MIGIGSVTQNFYTLQEPKKEADVHGCPRKYLETICDLFQKFLDGDAQGNGCINKDHNGHKGQFISFPAHISGVTSLRGTQTHLRVDIQGPSGNHGARIAVQEGGRILGQIVVPIGECVSKREMLSAMEASLETRKIAVFTRFTELEETNRSSSSSSTGQKGGRRGK